MGRPPKAESEAVLTAVVRFMATPEMKAWVISRGGGSYLRRLVEEDRERRGGKGDG